MEDYLGAAHDQGLTYDQGLTPDPAHLWTDVYSAPDTYQFESDLSAQMSAIQAQVDATIAAAEHSPGYGEGFNPNAYEGLHALNVADEISNSVDQDVQTRSYETAVDAETSDPSLYSGYDSGA
jgi:hypothetical protein